MNETESFPKRTAGDHIRAVNNKGRAANRDRMAAKSLRAEIEKKLRAERLLAEEGMASKQPLAEIVRAVLEAAE